MIPFEKNLTKETQLFVNIYKPASQSSQYFLDILGDLVEFYSQDDDNKVIFGGFNLEPSNPSIASFMNIQNLFNFVKNNTCFKGEDLCIDLILTNRKYSFKNTFSFKTGLSDHHHLIYSVIKTTTEFEEPKKFGKTRKNMITQISRKKFINVFIYKHASKKIKTFRGNQNPHINKTLLKAIMKRSQLKNKANKTRGAIDVSNYKK